MRREVRRGLDRRRICARGWDNSEYVRLREPSARDMCFIWGVETRQGTARHGKAGKGKTGERIENGSTQSCKDCK
jgi:hypothetical protein